MISKAEVQNLAELSRLELSDKEVVSLQSDISNILAYVGQVAAVSSQEEKVAGDNRNVLRSDVPRGADDLLAEKREAILAALPKREGDYALVRKIIQKDE
jgi:aspartyl/glutamyl-tRNA(Asn/Gln) amidotransferase C subunit